MTNAELTQEAPEQSGTAKTLDTTANDAPRPSREPRPPRRIEEDKDEEHPIKAIRRAAVPLCAIETPDPAATMDTIVKTINGAAAGLILACHDMIRGLQGLNKPGKAWVQSVLPDGVESAMATANPTECLALLAAKPPPERAIVFMNGAHAEIEDASGGFNPTVTQGIWNCRGAFEAQGSTLVLLGPAFRLPPMIARDVVLVTEPLPSPAQLDKLSMSVCEDYKTASPAFPMPTQEERPLIVDTLLGLSAFEAKQAIALSLKKTGLDRPGLWTRKVKAIEATQGLTVYRGKERFDAIGGLANAKREVGDTIAGKTDVSCIVFIDEIDKGMLAANTDTSGTTADQNKALLAYLQDMDILGSLFLGPPGTGKTQLAKCAANEYGIPLIMVDLGALKGSKVGESEQNMRQALRVIHAISDGRALFIGALNSDNLPAELGRRFNYLKMFFDLPSAAERAPMWQIHSKRLRFQGKIVTLRDEQITPVEDTGWTGAEIRNACLKAYAKDCTLAEAARSIIPISKTKQEAIQALRRASSGKYVSASEPGPYIYTENPEPITGPSRKF